MKSFAVLAFTAGACAQALVPTDTTLLSVVSSVVSSTAALSIVSQITDGQPQVPTAAITSVSAVSTKVATLSLVSEISVPAPKPSLPAPAPSVSAPSPPFGSLLTGAGQGGPTTTVTGTKTSTLSIISQITDGQIQGPPTSMPSATMPKPSIISAVGGSGSNATASIMPFNPNAAPAVKVSGSFFAFVAGAFGLCALVL